MIRSFWVMTMGLIFLIMGVAVHYGSFDRYKITKSLNRLTQVTQHSGLSLGRAYYESDTQSGNIVYPQMTSINRMDFVYEK